MKLTVPPAWTTVPFRRSAGTAMFTPNPLSELGMKWVDHDPSSVIPVVSGSDVRVAATAGAENAAEAISAATRNKARVRKKVITGTLDASSGDTTERCPR